MKLGQSLTQESIVYNFKQFIEKEGAGNCYVGITDNFEERLSAHNVYEPTNNILPPRLCFNAPSEADARNIERNFLKLGCQGGDGGGRNPTYIYIYRVMSFTKK
jgi:hypothetical protein